MKKLLVFLGLFFCFAIADYAQPHIARHYWLNDSSYNHTLALTSDGGYILAAARQERGANRRNTIAVFKLDAGYNIQNSRIIGLPAGGTGGGFDVGVNFEVHDVIENFQVDDDGNVISYYVICGSISRNGSPDIGMVTVVDAGLNTQSIRDYPDAEVFYSVYADGNYYYVCGKTPKPEGIVLRDNIFSMMPMAYITTQPWEYHKIKANNNGNDIVVSLTNGIEIGYTVFDISGGGFAPVVIATSNGPFFASFSFSLPAPPQPGSKVVLTDYPNHPQGLILSAVLNTPSSVIYEIYTYLFTNYLNLSIQPPLFLPIIRSDNGYRLQNTFINGAPFFLEDVNTAPASPMYPNGRIAWVGHAPNAAAPYRGAFYIAMYPPFLPMPPSPIPSPIPTYIFFNSFTNPPQYSQLHKVHYNNGDFHCGGFYTHTNNNKTTFVTAPEQAINNTTCGGSTSLYPFFSEIMGNPFSVVQMTVSTISIQWRDTKYNFCDTDCDNANINAPDNADCGNR